MELRYDIFMYYSVHVFPLMTDQWTFNIFFFLLTFVSLLNQLETDCVMSAFKKGKLKYKITDYDIFMYCSVQFFLLITDQRTLNIDLCINLSFPS